MSFYVYIHKKPNGEVFYVGKGTKGRAWNRHSRNAHWNNIYKKYGTFTVEIVANNLQEWYAFELEMDLILKYKTSGQPLTNVSFGGEGVSGLIVSEETKLKISKASTGIGNGRADKTIYTFVNIITRDEFVGSRCDFENTYGFHIRDLFKGKALTVYSWCLKENLDKLGPKLKYDPRLYLFRNKYTWEEVSLTRREFDKKFNINSKALFSGKLKSLHGWYVVGLKDTISLD